MKRKVKRFITILLTTIMMASVIVISKPQIAYAVDSMPESNFLYDVNENNEVVIIHYIGSNSGQLTIPSEIDNKPVVGIMAGAFENFDGLTGDLTIPESVTYIEMDAFNNCSGFDGRLTIPQNVRPWGQYCPFELYGISEIKNDSNGELKAGYVIGPGSTDYFVNVNNPDDIIGKDGIIGTGLYKRVKNFSTGTISVNDMTYTGEALTPIPVVSFDGKELKNGTDYSVSYNNNTNAGTATITVTGIGRYIGTISKTFKIIKQDQTITASDITKSTSDAAFSLDAKTNGDGQLSYSSANTAVVTVDNTGKVTINGPGKTTITITASATTNYNQSSKTINVTVTAPAKKSIASATVSGISDKTYTGKEITLSPTVTLEGKALQNGTDYTLSYENNVNPGTATVTITGTGSYTDSIKKTFTITKEEQAITENSTAKKSIAKASVTGLKSKTYTGKALTQNLKVKLGNNNLKVGTDYTVSYKNNKNAGTATITITGKGNYTGKKTVKFKIKKAANSLNVKAKKKTFNITYSKLAKKDQDIKQTQIYNITKKGQGKLSYALSSVKNGKKNVKTGFTVDKKTGKLTVKKSLKKSTYSVEVKVTAAGDKNHKNVTKKITIPVKVK